MGNEKMITLVNGREEISEVELLCAFELTAFDSKYILYTKGERDRDGHTIIYSGKLITEGEKQYLINVEEGYEWEQVKDVMRQMAKYSFDGDKK